MTLQATKQYRLDFEALRPSKMDPRGTYSQDLHLEAIDFKRRMREAGNTLYDESGPFADAEPWMFIAFMPASGSIVHQMFVPETHGRQIYRKVWSEVAANLCGYGCTAVHAATKNPARYAGIERTRPARITVFDAAFAQWLREEGLTEQAQRVTKVELVTDATVIRPGFAIASDLHPEENTFRALVDKFYHDFVEYLAKEEDDQHWLQEQDSQALKKMMPSETTRISTPLSAASTRTRSTCPSPQQEEECSPEEPCCSFTEGDMVVVRGLQSEQGKALNGQIGVVLGGGANSSTGRLPVKILAQVDVSRALKAENLWKPRFALGEHVDVRLGGAAALSNSPTNAAALVIAYTACDELGADRSSAAPEYLVELLANEDEDTKGTNETSAVKIVNVPLVLKQFKESELVRQDPAVRGKIRPNTEPLMWKPDKQTGIPGPYIAYNRYVSVAEGRFKIYSTAIDDPDGFVTVDTASDAPNVPADKAILQYHAQHEIPIRGRADGQCVFDLFTQKNDGSHLAPRPRDAEFEELVDTFIGFSHLHGQFASSRHNQAAYTNNVRVRKNRCLNRLRYLLGSKRLRMTQARARSLEGLFDPPRESTCYMGHGVSRDVELAIEPWFGQALDFYRLLERRDDVQPDDKDRFYDNCVQGVHKNSQYSRYISAVAADQAKKYATAQDLAVQLGFLSANYEYSLARRNKLAREALRLDLDGSVHDAALALAQDLQMRGQRAFALQIVAQTLHRVHVSFPRYREVLERILPVALKATAAVPEPSASTRLLKATGLEARELFQRVHEFEMMVYKRELRLLWSDMEPRPYLRQLMLKACLLAETGNHRAAAVIAKTLLVMNPSDTGGMRKECCNWCVSAGDFYFLRLGILETPFECIAARHSAVMLYVNVWMGIRDGAPDLACRFVEAVQEHPLCPIFILERAARLTAGEPDTTTEIRRFVAGEGPVIDGEEGDGEPDEHMDARMCAFQLTKPVWLDASLPGGGNGCDWLRRQVAATSRRPSKTSLDRLLCERRLLLKVKNSALLPDCICESSTRAADAMALALSSGSTPPSPMTPTALDLRIVYVTKRMQIIPFPKRPGRRELLTQLVDRDGPSSQGAITTTGCGPRVEAAFDDLYIVHDELQDKWIAFRHDDVVDAPLIDVLKKCAPPDDLALPLGETWENNSPSSRAQEQERARQQAGTDDENRERALFEEDMVASFLRQYRHASIAAKNITKKESAQTQRLLACEEILTQVEDELQDGRASFATRIELEKMKEELTESHTAVVALGETLREDVVDVISDTVEQDPDVLAVVEAHEDKLIESCRRLLRSATVTAERITKLKTCLTEAAETLDNLLANPQLPTSESLVANKATDGEIANLAMKLEELGVESCEKVFPQNPASAAADGQISETTKAKTSKCEFCGEELPKNSNVRKRHMKKCPKRPIFCDRDHCRMRIPADRFDIHLAEECESREVECPQCGEDTIPFWRLDDHTKTECRRRAVPCTHNHSAGCTWTGAFEDRSRHLLTCPYTTTECPQCMEIFPQYQRATHKCKQVPPHEDCMVCFESWEALASRGSMPAILLLDGRRSCVCKSYLTCIQCAEQVLSGATAENKTPVCPFCRKACNLIAPVSRDLLLSGSRSSCASKKQLPARRPPRDDDAAFEFTEPLCRPPVASRVGRTFWVSPLDIRFTHDSVKALFRDYYDQNEKAHRCHQGILDSLREVLRQQAAGLVPVSLECLDVCWADPQAQTTSASSSGGPSPPAPGKTLPPRHPRLYLAGTGNRRLTMWRLLALYRPHQFSLIKIRIVDRADPRVKFDEKCTTQNDGRSICVRGCGKVGLSKSELTWKEARDVLEDRK